MGLKRLPKDVVCCLTLFPAKSFIVSIRSSPHTLTYLIIPFVPLMFQFTDWVAASTSTGLSTEHENISLTPIPTFKQSSLQGNKKINILNLNGLDKKQTKKNNRTHIINTPQRISIFSKNTFISLDKTKNIIYENGFI